MVLDNAAKYPLVLVLTLLDLASVIGRAGLCWLGSGPMDAQWTHNP
jgi:hypothetical protein